MNDAAARESRMWTGAFSALAVLIAAGSILLAHRAEDVKVVDLRVVPTVGLVSVDYGADGEIDDEVMVAVEGFAARAPSAPVAARRLRFEVVR